MPQSHTEIDFRDKTMNFWEGTMKGRKRQKDAARILLLNGDVVLGMTLTVEQIIIIRNKLDFLLTHDRYRDEVERLEALDILWKIELDRRAAENSEEEGDDQSDDAEDQQ